MRRLDDLEVQRRILEREAAIGADHAERLAEIAKDKVEVESRLKALRSDGPRSSNSFPRSARSITRLKARAGAAQPLPRQSHPLPLPPHRRPSAPNCGAALPPPKPRCLGGRPALRAELARLEAELAALQGETPMMRVAVDAQIVGEVLSAWTGIPVGKMLKDEIATVLSLSSLLGKRVIGQAHALEMVAQRVQTSRAALDDPIKPIGVFMLVGPSGVGKTETALALSDLLYGGEHNLITINMSEFQEAHTVSTLKGSPPGYVGYGEGGVLDGSRPPASLLGGACSTRWRRRIPTFWNSSTRSSTRA